MQPADAVEQFPLRRGHRRNYLRRRCHARAHRRLRSHRLQPGQGFNNYGGLCFAHRLNQSEHGLCGLRPRSRRRRHAEVRQMTRQFRHKPSARFKMLPRARLNIVCELRQVRRVKQRRRRHSEDSSSPLHRGDPRGFRRQPLLAQVRAVVRQIRQACIERSTVPEEAAVRLCREHEDDQVGAFLGQAHRLGLIDPLPKILHFHRPARLGSLAREVVFPPLTK